MVRLFALVALASSLGLMGGEDSPKELPAEERKELLVKLTTVPLKVE